MLLGNGNLKLAHEKMRYLHAKDPFVVKEYIDAMHEYLDNHNVWNLHNKLINLTTHDAELAEQSAILDKRIGGQFP
eukprot:3721523-Ditylum_brightwellii.AAC.1